MYEYERMYMKMLYICAVHTIKHNISYIQTLETCPSDASHFLFDRRRPIGYGIFI